MWRRLNAPKSSTLVQGVVFSVRPPRKSWKAIANLSGGEKTLASLALVFALHHYKPTPLYVMDEIDAALGASPNSVWSPRIYRYSRWPHMAWSVGAR